MKKLIFGVLSLALVLGMAGFAHADITPITPSTNDINRTNSWAHVDQLSQGLGTTQLQFISTRNFWSCFEYRTDGDTTQVLSENGGVNYNTQVTDGLYPYVCEKNSSETITISAKSYVEVRMVFGAETDERFDWTRFDVIPLVAPGDKEECKLGGWQDFNDPVFKNQGDCVSFVESSPKALGNKNK